MAQKTCIMVSGGFDPLHKGHVELIRRAAKFGDVYVILNSDSWLERKKGKAFMSFDERRYILEALRDVKMVWRADDTDGSVSSTLKKIITSSPACEYTAFLFGNGGDRAKLNTPEVDTCIELGIGLVWGLGNKVQSSSMLIQRAATDLVTRHG